MWRDSTTMYDDSELICNIVYVAFKQNNLSFCKGKGWKAFITEGDNYSPMYHFSSNETRLRTMEPRIFYHVLAEIDEMREEEKREEEDNDK